MNNQSTNKIIVRVQTADEEFEYLMKVLNKMDFYNQHGYKIPIPDHPFFLNISNNLGLIESLDAGEARGIFKKEVYNPSFFENGIKTVNKNIELVEKAVKKMEKWKNWKFKLFPKYEVRLTLYGPGGSYDFNHGNIIMKTKKNGEFGRVPYHTIVHEIIHIGIEESIVKKFELTHVEKEGLVDSICANYFGDMLIDYRVQNLGEKKVFALIDKDNIMKLPEIIRKYKKK
ncbi:MAG: hypothetical protein U9O55_02485 [Patescibacteria group bacterium]|nr:hypothetical protein [Patescibacteria group bacterium]